MTMLSTAILGAALAAVARAAQPGAVQPVAAPMRDLQWGQLNFLHTTDTHGWLGGHLRQPQYSADWGDYVSFAHHMRALADDRDADLLLVDTGDRIEGNGLYDASNPKGLFQYAIYAEQHVDIICSGNHELYQPYSIDRERNTTIPNFHDAYVASNLDYVDPETGDRSPLAQRYRRFTTRNRGFDVLAFGFLFDFDGAAPNAVVQPVEDAIKEDWFRDAMREDPDLFVVVGHVGLRMEEFEAVFTAIRKEHWHTPIAFFGGHAHVRDTRKFDSQALAMASGRYMETVGWMSIDGIKKQKKGGGGGDGGDDGGDDDDSSSSSAMLEANAKEVEEDKSGLSARASLKFSRKYIDNNLYGMHYHTGLNDTSFPTEHGVRVSRAIDRARTAMGLDYTLGCAPRNLWMSRAKFPGNESIYSWVQDEVLHDVVASKERADRPRLALLNTGGIRFDILEGPFTVDSAYMVSPFSSGFKYVPDVPYKVAKRVLGLLNSGEKILGARADSRWLGVPQQMFTAGSTSASPGESPDTSSDASPDGSSRLELRGIQDPMGQADEPALISGYTTKDDLGDDGDDTVRERIDFHAVPNCVQAQIAFPDDGSDPEAVDVVFIDFIQPWIIPALKFSGGDYGDGDVEDYMDGTFTYAMSEWIRENWDGRC